MRLDKYISNSTDHSRAQVKKLAKSGAITINGLACSNPATKIAPNDLVAIDDIPVAAPGPRYFMLFKPQGYVCATRDGENPTVLDLLDEPRLGELQVAGRLDIDTTGLVLITDDGKWNHAITAPQKQCKKIYQVTTSDDIPLDTIDKFEQGVWLDGEKTITRPASLEITFSNECRLGLSEGRYHQVKRMFAAVNNHVETLHRQSVGNIELDPGLEQGEYRPLTPGEVESVFDKETNPTPPPKKDEGNA